jgi:hypothetical protein
MLMGLALAFERQKSTLKIPFLGIVVLIVILVVAPLLAVAAVCVDVADALSGGVVVLAGELLRKEPELYEEGSFILEVGRKKNVLLDVFLAQEVHRDGSVFPRPGDLGCTSVHVRRRLRRSLREGEGVALLGGANGRVFARRARDTAIAETARTHRP